ncbi:hypothetical protein RFI_28486, partial [Reticulomyxa filosa]
ISASSSNSEQKKNQSDTKDNNNNNISNGNNESNNSNTTASTSTNTTNNNNNNNNQNRQQVSPELKTFQIFCQTRVKIRTTSFFYSAQYREEDELIGLPLLLTLPLTRDVSFKEVRQKILDLIRPFLTSKERLKLTKEKQLPFVIYALYGNNTVLQLEEKDGIAPLTERSFRFLVHFPERNAYNEDSCIREKRRRHETAPPPMGKNSSGDEEDRSSSKPVMLSSCISAFTEEEILDENDAWYCSKCAAFKCAKKKIDLWSTPDLLIIHLKRFSYTRQWRDRINTL